MANALYTTFKEHLLDNALNGLDLKLVLVDTAVYTPNLTTDEFLDDIPAGARIATSANLASVTFTAGALDAANPADVTGVTGDSGEAVVLYIDSGVEGTSRLLMIYDTATGLPTGDAPGTVRFTIDPSGFFSL